MQVASLKPKYKNVKSCTFLSPKLTHFHTGWKESKKFLYNNLGVWGLVTYVDKVLKDIRSLFELPIRTANVFNYIEVTFFLLKKYLDMIQPYLGGTFFKRFWIV